jgi:hypothetical protein
MLPYLASSTLAFDGRYAWIDVVDATGVAPDILQAMLERDPTACFQLVMSIFLSDSVRITNCMGKEDFSHRQRCERMAYGGLLSSSPRKLTRLSAGDTAQAGREVI